MLNRLAQLSPGASLPGRLRRGASLIPSLAIAFMLVSLGGASVVYVTSSYSLSWSRSNSEAAVLLAEAGVNWEMREISEAIGRGIWFTGHEKKTLAGEPYPGQPGTIDGMPGRFWVYVTDPKGDKPWSGYGALRITCTAEVGGARQAGSGNWGPAATRTVSVVSVPQSVFSAFAVFGLDVNTNNQPSIGIAGGASLQVNGNVGANGRIQGGSGTINYTRAYNYNVERVRGERFAGGEAYDKETPLVLPTVTEVLASIVPPSAKSDPWSWLRKHNDNDQIRQYAPVLGSLSSLGTVKIGAKREQSVLTNSNTDPAKNPEILSAVPDLLKGKDGSWTAINAKPGSLSVRTLIFPPGDYYFTEMNLLWDSTTEIVIDNAGLTTPSGKNDERRQVRFWFNGTSSKDTVSLPIKLTDPDDPTTFRIYYGKDGSNFEFIRDSNFKATEFVVAGAVYAVTNKLNPSTGLPVDSSLKGTQIDLKSTSSSTPTAVLYGSLIADRVTFHGACKIVYPSGPMDQLYDPKVGVGFGTSCDGPCYSDGGG